MEVSVKDSNLSVEHAVTLVLVPDSGYVADSQRGCIGHIDPLSKSRGNFTCSAQ